MIQERERGKEKKLEMLAVEQQIRQAKEEENFLIALNKKSRDDLLKEISKVRSKGLPLVQRNNNYISYYISFLVCFVCCVLTCVINLFTIM